MLFWVGCTAHIKNHFLQVPDKSVRPFYDHLTAPKNKLYQIKTATFSLPWICVRHNFLLNSTHLLPFRETIRQHVSKGERNRGNNNINHWTERFNQSMAFYNTHLTSPPNMSTLTDWLPQRGRTAQLNSQLYIRKTLALQVALNCRNTKPVSAASLPLQMKNSKK